MPPFVTPLPIGSAQYCDERVCLSVCLCVCLSTIISSQSHDRSSPIFLCLLPMAAARSFSGDVVICHVFPVLWMTSYLHISRGCSTSPPGLGSEAHMYAALGLVRRNTRCRQRTLGTTSCSQRLLGRGGRVEYL